MECASEDPAHRPVIQVIPQAQWKATPVQPAAGSYRLVTSCTTWFLFGTLPFFAVGALSATWFPQWLFYAVAALLFIEIGIAGTAAFMAIPTYRAERALGYTTWPEKDEIQSS